MKHEAKKISLIIDELMTVMLLHGAKEINIKIKREENKTEIIFEYLDCDYGDDFLEELQESLNIQRQSEVEGYYWQLCGDDDEGDELFLVGAMIDEAEVERKGKNVLIHIVRKETEDE